MKVVELFAGVGGFRVGLERASSKYTFVWANQWEPNKTKQHAFECYVSHFGNSKRHVNQDISKVKQSIPNHDLLVGGFPCQDYSVASTGAKGIEGKKGVLWWEIRDILDTKRPKYFLLENVDRLIKSPSKQRGRDFGIMLKSLTDLGYIVEWRIINAAEYENSQRRRRIFLFGYQEKTKIGIRLRKFSSSSRLLFNGVFAKSFKCIKNENKADVQINLNDYTDLVDMTNNFTADFKNAGICEKGQILSFEVTSVKEKSINLSDILENKFVDEKYYIEQKLDKFTYLKGAKKIPRVKPNGEIYYYSEGAIAFPDSLDLPARTILTSESSINRSTHVIKDPRTNRLRILTEIECERLNGFEDNWTNTGMTPKLRYFCMGNALVTGIIERIGRTLIEY